MKTLLIAAGGLAALVFIAIAVWVYVVQNVETPDYRVLRADGAIELRRYPPLVVAEVSRTGPRRDALSQGFGPLARYIFAREREGPKIAMTAPVTQSPAGGPQDWTVSFIMPAGSTPDDLPRPTRGEVRLAELPATTRAAIRFSGHAGDADIADNEARLRAWLAAEGIATAGPPVYAYYNDPFTPGFLRRNEVLIEIARDTADARAAGAGSD